ncbi:MAG: PD-(D/E)XK nuclease family protein, partial [Microcystis sp.]
MSNIYRLAQVHLNLLETCPPRFQKVYLEQLNTPADPGQLE